MVLQFHIPIFSQDMATAKMYMQLRTNLNEDGGVENQENYPRP